MRATLARWGVRVPVGGYLALTDETCGGAMEVVPFAGGTALQCGWGC